MKSAHKKIVFETLEKMYPDADTELHRETPFQLIVAVILSAQSTDKHINNVTAVLFEHVRSPQDVLDLGYDAFHQLLLRVNYHNNKATNIYKLSQQLSSPSSDIKHAMSNTTAIEESPLLPAERDIYATYGYHIPSDRQQLRQLPGIGEKTAKVVLHVLYDLPLIAVDTHVHRVANRLGIVSTKTPDQTSKIIEKAIPPHYHQIAHHGLIFFGRYHCIARKPVCNAGADQCPFSAFCPHFNKVIKKSL